MPEAPAKPLNRRAALVGAGTAGALAAAAVVLPRLTGAAAEADAATASPKPELTPGYQVTEHVQHYYRTTRV